MIRPNKLDWLIYKLFYWRWNKILASRPDLVKVFKMTIDKWVNENENN